MLKPDTIFELKLIVIIKTLKWIILGKRFSHLIFNQRPSGKLKLYNIIMRHKEVT